MGIEPTPLSPSIWPDKTALLPLLSYPAIRYGAGQEGGEERVKPGHTVKDNQLLEYILIIETPAVAGVGREKNSYLAKGRPTPKPARPSMKDESKNPDVVHRDFGGG